MLGTSSVNGIRLIKPKNFGTECKIIGSYSLISLFFNGHTRWSPTSIFSHLLYYSFYYLLPLSF